MTDWNLLGSLDRVYALGSKLDRLAVDYQLRDRLESLRLVTREAHPTDRRARIVRLTEASEKRAVKFFASHKEAMDSAASGLSKTERLTLIELLKKLGISVGARASAAQGEG